ncbi:MAG: 30S ribosomal protein S20 [Candidatus Colwellbacteria bacterium]|nr:30S ribosomal protein S20 [Candidatus Colwellbacteria bacterium]
MPVTQSAKKALRQATRRKAKNLRRKNDYKNSIKELKKLITAGKNSEAVKFISKVYKTLDKASKTNVIKKNKAARLKSAAAKLIAKK